MEFDNGFELGTPIRIVRKIADINNESVAKHIWTAFSIYLKYDPKALKAFWWHLGHEYQLSLWPDSENLIEELSCDLPINLIRDQLLINEGLYTVGSPIIQIYAAAQGVICNLNEAIVVSPYGTIDPQLPSLLQGVDIENITKDDNIRITLETAIMGNLWPADYIYEISNNNGFHQFPLLHSVLHNNNMLQADMTKAKYHNILKTAPCEGPWASPDYLPWPAFSPPEEIPRASGGWAGRDRLSHPGGKDVGPTQDLENGQTTIQPAFRGEFPGLDYMLYYNLYHLLFADELPDYKKSTSCKCVEQFTYAEELTEDYTVGAKFPSYRAMGIESPSFLSHDLLISSAAELTISNDLVLCGGDEDDYTELIIGDGSRLTNQAGTDENLYTVTANEYSRIIIEENAFFTTNSSSNGVKLILKTGSELIVKSGATLDFMNNDGLVIEEYANVTIESGATVTFSNFNEIDNNGLFHIEDGATVTINESDVVFLNRKNIDAYGDLIIDGGILESHHFIKSFGDVKIINNGLLDIKEESEFVYSPECELTIEGDGSILQLEGTIKLKSYANFQINHPNDISGKIHGIGAAKFIGYNGTLNRITLIGDDENDIILTGKINVVGSNIYKMELRDCKVEVDLSVGQPRLYGTNVKFSNGEVTSRKYARYSNCAFTNNYVYSEELNNNPYLLGLNSTFDNSCIRVIGGGYSLRDCDVSNISFNQFYLVDTGSEEVYPMVYSQGLTTNSSLKNCNFEPGSASLNAPIVSYLDLESNVLISVQKSLFDGFGVGMLKTSNGDLRLKCNHFAYNVKAIKAGKYTSVYMDVAHNSGYNYFSNNTTAVYLKDAKRLELNNGYNDFSNNSSLLFEGTLTNSSSNNPCVDDGSCGSTYSTPLSASHNFWKCCNGLNTPSNASYDLYYADVCGGGSIQNCAITIVDPTPAGNTACGSKDKITIPKSKSFNVASDGKPLVGSGQNKDNEEDNPVLTTFTFDGLTLDSALVYSISQMTYYDSLTGNNEYALNLLHEVLTSDLDRANDEIRFKMNWAQDYMKMAVEDLFQEDLISDSSNVYSFHPLTQKYVDVLNVLTDTLVTDSNYRELFYLEIDKAQFFRLIGNPEMSYQLAGQIGTCDIDSLEQDLVNDWLKSLQYEMYPDSLLSDSVSFEPDTTLFTTPTILNSNEFFFGSIIMSPNTVVYNPCQVSLKDILITINKNNFFIYPNPNPGRFIIQNLGDESQIEIRLLTEQGDLIFKQTKFVTNNEEWIIDLDKPARGIYTLQIINGKAVENHKLVIQ